MQATPLHKPNATGSLTNVRLNISKRSDPDFSKAYAFQFNRKDSEGTDHTFADLQKGIMVDVFNDIDDNFCVSTARGSATPSESYVFFVDVVQSKGVANGLARVKIFEAAEVETTNFVRKSGDTITGPLVLDPDKTGNPLTVKANDAGNSRSIVVNVRGQTKEDGKRPGIFTVNADGEVGIDDDVEIKSKWQVPHKNMLTKRLQKRLQR